MYSLCNSNGANCFSVILGVRHIWNLFPCVMAMYLPFGEKDVYVTGTEKDIRWRMVPLRKWTSIALPSAVSSAPFLT